MRDERQPRKRRCWPSFSRRFCSTTCSASRNFLDKPVRQDVAVMFLDLSGSTGVAEVLGPERSRDLLQRHADIGGAGGDGAPRHRHQLYGRRGSGGLRTAEAAERRRRAGAGHGRKSLHVGRRLAGRSAAPRRGIASTFASAFISARLSCRGSVPRPISRSPPLATPSMSRAGSSRWRSSSTAASSSRKICSRPRARRLGSANVDVEAYAPLTVPIRGRTGFMQVRVRK